MLLRGLMDGSNNLELLILNYRCNKIKTVYGYCPGNSEYLFKIHRTFGSDLESISYAEIPSLGVKIEDLPTDEIIGVLREKYKIPIPNTNILEQGGIFWDKYNDDGFIVYKDPNNEIASIVAHRKIDNVCTKVVIEKNRNRDEEEGWYLNVNGQKEGPFELNDSNLSKMLKEYDIVLPPEDELI